MEQPNRKPSSCYPSPACDRCHTIKAKCISSNISPGCSRCFRLQHECTYFRERQLPGRKKHGRSSGLPNSTEIQYRWIQLQPGTIAGLRRASSIRLSVANQLDRIVVSSEASNTLNAARRAITALPLRAPIISDRQLFHDAIDHDPLIDFYVIVPTLVPKVRATVKATISDGPPILRDLYLALTRAFESGQTGYELPTGVLALQMLRDARIRDKTELIYFLWLGILLKSFDRLVLGTSTHLICETTLLQLQRYHTWTLESHSASDATICLIFTHTVTCLLNSQVPIVEFRSYASGTVDRYAGLCCDLLPILYNICNLLGAHYAGRPLDLSVWTNTYRSVEDWYPQCALDLASRFSPHELVVLQSQAYSYRAAAILILHRLRYSIDVQADVMSWCTNEILEKMGNCVSVVGEPPAHTITPILIGALELVDDARRREALDLFDRCRVAKKSPSMSRLKEICHAFWRHKDTGGSSEWFTFLRTHYYPLNICI